MIGISTKAIYAINIMYTLGFTPTRPCMQIKDIATLTRISHPYVEQILAALKKAHLVVSVRGAKGGYQLANIPAHVRVLEIVNAIDGDVRLTPPAQISNDVLQALFSEVHGRIQASFDLSLSQLHQKFQPFMYEI